MAPHSQHGWSTSLGSTSSITTTKPTELAPSSDSLDWTATSWCLPYRKRSVCYDMIIIIRFAEPGVFQLGFRKCLRTACNFPEWLVTRSFSKGSAFLTSQRSPKETTVGCGCCFPLQAQPPSSQYLCTSALIVRPLNGLLELVALVLLF